MIDAVFVRDGVVDCVIRNIDVLPEGAIAAASETVFGGYTYAGGGLFLAPPAPPAPVAVMPDLSDRQFGEGLWRDGLIDFPAYLAFVGPGVIPDDLMAIINTLPDDNTGGPTPRKVALGLVTGAQTYEFDNPFVEPMRQAFERKDPIWTASYFRERWLAWSAL